MSPRRVLAAIVLTICIGAPIIEGFDQWDDAIASGNETETNIVIVALCVGLALSVTTAIVHASRAMIVVKRLDVARVRSLVTTERVFSLPATTGHSPPLPLRI